METAVFNPNNRPVEELPVIYGFNNGGSPGFFMGALIAEDGEEMGGHVCSSENYMLHDLGILPGSRPDRHETFKAKFPDGYRMEFVRYADVEGHLKLNEAFQKGEERYANISAEDTP
jgi:hypothetical protein